MTDFRGISPLQSSGDNPDITRIYDYLNRYMRTINSESTTKWDTVTSKVSSVTGTLPISVTSGTTPVVSIASATTSVAGATMLSNLYNGTSQVKATTEKALSDGLATIHARKHNLDGTDDHTGISGTENNFMGITAGGLPKDSGSKAGDFATSGHNHSGTYQPADAGLTALASVGTGIIANTAVDTFAGRTITGTSNQISVSNGDGVSGNPTISTPQDIHTGASPTFASLTLSGLTAGSVLFSGVNGLFSQDNSNFFWDNTNKKLGIGTASPGEIVTACTTANRSSLLFSSGVSPRTSHTILYSGFDAQNSTTVEVASDTYGSFLISANQPNAAYAYLGGLSWVNRYGRAEGTDELRVAYIAGKTDLATNSCLLSFLLASSGVLSEKMLLNSSGNLQINGKLSVGTSALPGTTLEVKNTTSSFTADFLGSGQSSIVRNQAPTAVNQVAYTLHDYDDPNNKWASIGLERTTAPILGGTRNDLIIRQGTSGRDIRFGTNIGGTIATRAMLVSAGYFGVNVTPTSHVHSGGSFAAAVTPKSANFTADVNGYHYTVTTGSVADVTATLPAAAGCSGRIYVFTKVDSGTKNVIIDGNLSETINGALTKTSTAQYDSITIQSDGTNWLITAMPFNAWT